MFIMLCTKYIYKLELDNCKIDILFCVPQKSTVRNMFVYCIILKLSLIGLAYIKCMRHDDDAVITDLA